MNDRYRELKRQSERGNQLDEKARDIYRITFVVISIFIAAAAISVDMNSIFHYLVFESGPLLNEEGITIVPSEYQMVSHIILTISILLLLFSYIIFVVLLISGLILFTASPYYAIRSVTCSKITEVDRFYDVLGRDVRELSSFLNPFSGVGNNPHRTSQIICDVTYDPESHASIESVIRHNKKALEYKSRNLARAETSTKLFFVALLTSALILLGIFGSI